MSFKKLTMGALTAVLAASACEAANNFQGGRLPPNARPATSDALYQRLGRAEGIRTVMTDFVGRAAADPKINGYFLNAVVNPARVIECLVLQVGTLTGGPFTYPSMGCRGMKEVHKDMKISTNDFNDTAGHLVAALQAARVSAADIDILVKAVASTAPEIVEDANNNMTVYQRVGRKPNIEAVVLGFMDTVFRDPAINGFFVGGNAERLRTCLTRLVCSVDGPCKYGQEVDGAEPGVARNNPCKGMVESHQGINATARPITKADFDALVGDLVRVLDGAGVAAADKMALLGALGPMCKDIVKGGTGCP
jgi:truncated hemoglobin YjbI